MDQFIGIQCQSQFLGNCPDMNSTMDCQVIHSTAVNSFLVKRGSIGKGVDLYINGDETYECLYARRNPWALGAFSLAHKKDTGIYMLSSSRSGTYTTLNVECRNIYLVALEHACYCTISYDLTDKPRIILKSSYIEDKKNLGGDRCSYTVSEGGKKIKMSSFQVNTIVKIKVEAKLKLDFSIQCGNITSEDTFKMSSFKVCMLNRHYMPENISKIFCQHYNLSIFLVTIIIIILIMYWFGDSFSWLAHLIGSLLGVIIFSVLSAFLQIKNCKKCLSKYILLHFICDKRCSVCFKRFQTSEQRKKHIEDCLHHQKLGSFNEPIHIIKNIIYMFRMILKLITFTTSVLIYFWIYQTPADGFIIMEKNSTAMIKNVVNSHHMNIPLIITALIGIFLFVMIDFIKDLQFARRCSKCYNTPYTYYLLLSIAKYALLVSTIFLMIQGTHSTKCEDLTLDIKRQQLQFHLNETKIQNSFKNYILELAKVCNPKEELKAMAEIEMSARLDKIKEEVRGVIEVLEKDGFVVDQVNFKDNPSTLGTLNLNDRDGKDGVYSGNLKFNIKLVNGAKAAYKIQMDLHEPRFIFEVLVREAYILMHYIPLYKTCETISNTIIASDYKCNYNVNECFSQITKSKGVVSKSGQLAHGPSCEAFNCAFHTGITWCLYCKNTFNWQNCYTVYKFVHSYPVVDLCLVISGKGYCKHFTQLENLDKEEFGYITSTQSTQYLENKYKKIAIWNGATTNKKVITGDMNSLGETDDLFGTPQIDVNSNEILHYDVIQKYGDVETSCDFDSIKHKVHRCFKDTYKYWSKLDEVEGIKIENLKDGNLNIKMTAVNLGLATFKVKVSGLMIADDDVKVLSGSIKNCAGCYDCEKGFSCILEVNMSIAGYSYFLYKCGNMPSYLPLFTQQFSAKTSHLIKLYSKTKDIELSCSLKSPSQNPEIVTPVKSIKDLSESLINYIELSGSHITHVVDNEGHVDTYKFWDNVSWILRYSLGMVEQVFESIWNFISNPYSWIIKIFLIVLFIVVLLFIFYLFIGNYMKLRLKAWFEQGKKMNVYRDEKESYKDYRKRVGLDED